MMDQALAVNFVDWVVFCFLLLGLFMGLRRGLSGQIGELFNVAAPLVAGWWLCKRVAAVLLTRSDLSPSSATLVAFFGLAIAGYMVVRVARWLLRKTIDFKFRRPLEPVGGALLGLLIVAGLALVVLVAADWLPDGGLRRELTERSLTGRALAPAAAPLRRFVLVRFPDLQRAKEPAVREWRDEPANSGWDDDDHEELVPRAIRPVDEVPR